MTQAITKTTPAAMELKSMLATPSVQERLNACLGARANQFATSLLSLTNASLQLQKCKPATILTAAMTAATLDLPINKDLGFAWIVPYKDEAQFQMGYKGFIQLAMRTGQYKAMNAVPVNAEALNGFNWCGEPEIDWHKFDPTKPAVGYWFGFELINGFRKAEYWCKPRVEAHAARFSQAFRTGAKEGGRPCPWQTDFDAMALKTVIKLTLAKWGILSVEMQTAMDNDQAVIPAIDAEAVYVDNGEITEDTRKEAAADLTLQFAPTPQP
jgi:recombination protein RecT